MTDQQWLCSEFVQAIPPDREPSVAKWAEQHVKVFGAAGEDFKPDRTPWTIEPLERTDDGITRIVTFVKPVQSGGSVVGEIALCRWIACHSGGDVQYNWEDDKKAGERWGKRPEKIFHACAPLMERKHPDPNKWRGNSSGALVMFPHLNFTMQGAFSESNLASDSIRFQVNEEIHNWEAGRLKQAYNRTTAYWNSVIVNISNASTKGDQLHIAYDSGTQQQWEVKCPGCGLYHAMRTQWDEKRPDLGGLRYDSSKHSTGEYDYNKIVSTLRMQMPCGYQQHESVIERRQLSLTGRYSEPRNPSAPSTNRSYTLESVSIDYIPWIRLVEEKHDALRALRYGDPEPFRVYCKERECKFWDPEDRPIVGKVTVVTGSKKNRDGLKDRAQRLFALDRQQGVFKDGELPHWWLVIRDVMPSGDSMLVWEGKCETDEQAIGVITEHGCLMRCGVADSGDDTTHVYQFCFRYGINAVKGSAEEFFHHPPTPSSPKGSKRIYAVPKPLHGMINRPPMKAYVNVAGTLHPHPDEPMFWHYSKFGLFSRLAWLRDMEGLSKQLNVPKPKWEVPEDVSEDYRRHMEAWQLEQQRSGKSREVVNVWVKQTKRDDLFMDECYIAMLMEMAGLIGERK